MTPYALICWYHKSFRIWAMTQALTMSNTMVVLMELWPDLWYGDDLLLRVSRGMDEVLFFDRRSFNVGTAGRLLPFEIGFDQTHQLLWTMCFIEASSHTYPSRDTHGVSCRGQVICMHAPRRCTTYLIEASSHVFCYLSKNECKCGWVAVCEVISFDYLPTAFE